MTGRENFGGIQLIVYEPKSGIFPDEPLARRNMPPSIHQEACSLAGEMGMGAGGKIRQKIYPDQYGIGTWDQNNSTRLSVYILNSEQYRQITGLEPPPTPISTETYVSYGLPWFDLYDESKADLPPPSELKGIKTVGKRGCRGGQQRGWRGDCGG